MAKPSNAVKDRWNSKAYDDLRIRIPKGQKTAVEEHAKGKGQSVNGLINSLLKADMGLEEWPEGRESQT